MRPLNGYAGLRLGTMIFTRGLSSGIDGGLLDLSQPISTATSDPWTTVEQGQEIVLEHPSGARSSRGGWAMETVDGATYEVSWDIAFAPSDVSPVGTSARVSPDDQISYGNGIVSANTDSQGSIQFQGTGDPVWVGPAFTDDDGLQGITIRKYRVDLVSRP